MKNCPYCAEEIQDAAVICKHCKRELTPGAAVQTIELTSKKLKKNILLSVVAILLSIPCFIAGFNGVPIITAIGMLLLFGGFIWFIITRIQIWWQHK